MADKRKTTGHPRQTIIMELSMSVVQLFGEGLLFDSRHVAIEISYENNQVDPVHRFCERIVEKRVNQAVEEGGK